MSRKNITDIQVLIAQDKWKKNPSGKWSYEILHEETGEPIKVCYAALERAHNRGLLEYGVSLRTAWFTDKGNKMIESYLNAQTA